MNIAASKNDSTTHDGIDGETHIQTNPTNEGKNLSNIIRI